MDYLAMGKSPAKWIKSLLSRKKSSRSHGSKKREASGKGNGTPDSPVISQPLPVNASRNGTPLEIVSLSSTTTNGVISSTNDQDPVTVASAGTATEDEIREEKAAVKVQSAFRGFLARRAFHALRGIIRLQALIRGHLVRRQAIATLRCMQAILKLQALARGRKIDSSRSLQKMKFSSNTFVWKLRSSYPVAMPLKIQYGKYDLNSAWNWLERWTYSQLWKPPVQIKKSVVQTESSKSKRTTRRNPYACNSESGSSSIIATKRNFKKLVGSSVNPVQEQPPLSELEKVKYNLRKISNSVAQSDCTADVPENESVKEFTEKIKNNENTLASDAPISIPLNEATLETSIKTLPDIKVNMDSAREQVEADIVANGVNDGCVSELQSLNGFVEDKNVNSLTVETTPYKEQASQENQKSSKRRASLTANLDCHEDDLNNTPTLPSYMAATKSAKAKLRGLTSPRISSDGIEKNGFARRHSLPSLTNKKLSPLTSQTQKRGQANGRMGVRNDMPIQVEWRR